MQTTWYFVRHCQSVSNRKGLLTGQSDSSLSWYGYCQCLTLLGRAKRLRVSRIISSDLTRALRTAKFLKFGHRADLVVTRELRERSLGVFEGRSRKQLKEPGVLEALRTWDYRPAGGESRKDVAVRVLRWLCDLRESDRTLIVSHYTVLRILLDVLHNVLGHPLVEDLENREFIVRTIEADIWKKMYAQIIAS
jgi:broad specificity phosphatase PhoE